MKSKSPIITEGEPVMIKNGMRPVHPGEILFEEFMKPADPPINANMLAKALEVPANRITAIVKGQRGITGDTAVRLATFFDTTAEFWMNLQMYPLTCPASAIPTAAPAADRPTILSLLRVRPSLTLQEPYPRRIFPIPPPPAVFDQ